MKLTKEDIKTLRESDPGFKVEFDSEEAAKELSLTIVQITERLYAKGGVIADLALAMFMLGIALGVQKADDARPD